MSRYLIFAWVVIAVLLLLYSFTQVDLGLTLTRISIWTQIQKSFQYIGYFNRSLSALLYCSIVVLLTTLYGLTLWVAKKNNLERKTFWTIIIILSIVLFFSYNALSYDFFNYIFDAKIFTHYNENPYLKKALDYPGDPMLGFMHWTHRTYPYGPVWLGLTIPLSFLGAGYFLMTFYLFKMLVVAAFLGTVYFLEKVLTLIDVKRKYFALALFALNPLTIVESLVSGHNDIVMMFLALAALYFLLSKRVVVAIIFLLLSIGVKFATIFLIPAFLYTFYMYYKKKALNHKIFALLSIGGMLLPIILASVRTNFQPWYLLFVLPLVPLLAYKKYIYIPAFVMSFVGLIYYAPFLYSGNWDDPIPKIINSLIIIGVVLSVFSTVLYTYRKRL